MRKLLIVIPICALVAVAIAALQPRTFYCPASLESQCKNNLKQIGLALHIYHDRYGSFPPAYLADANGKPAHSWRVLILPFIDCEELYREYRFDEPWNGPHNSKLAGGMPAVFRCPNCVAHYEEQDLETTETKQMTNYVAISAPKAVLSGSRTTKLSDITDGASSTILVAETQHHAVHWMQPQDVDPQALLAEIQSAEEPDRTNHHLGLHVLLTDRTIRFIPATIDRDAFDGLVTFDGHEAIDEKWLKWWNRLDWVRNRPRK